MRKDELYINNVLVDLNLNETKIQRTLTINSLGNFTSKQSSYSNTIKLPKTSRNLNVFEGISLMGNTSTSPYKKLPCKYFYEGLPIFLDGYCVVTSVSDTINITIYNGLIELAESIKNLTLTDLNFTDLEHKLDIESYTNIVNDSSLPYTYCLLVNFDSANVDEDVTYHQYDSFKLDTTYPFVKSSWLFNKIFEEAGYTVTGDLFSNPLYSDTFLNEYVSITNGQETRLSQITSSPIATYSSELRDESSNDSGDVDQFLNELNIINDEYFRVLTFSDDEISTLKDGYIEIELDLFFSTNNVKQIEVKIYQNGTVIYNLYYNELNSIDFYDKTINIGLNVNTGDDFKFEIELDKVQDKKLSYSLKSNVNIKYSNPQDIIYTINEDTYNFGSIKQSDFIKDILNRYGLLINKNQLTNEYEIKGIETLLDDFDNAIDFSNELVNISNESYKTTYSQNNIFKYKYDVSNDDENINNEYWNSNFTIDNQILNDEKTIYTSILTLPKFDIKDRNFTVKYTDGEDFNFGEFSKYNWFHIPLVQSFTTLNSSGDVQIEDDVLEDGEVVTLAANISINTVESTSTSPMKSYHFFKNNNVPSIINFNNNNIAVTIPVNVVDTDYELFYSWENILNRYYKRLINVVQEYKLISITLNLNINQLTNLNFYNLIYLKQTGRYYYINKIVSDITNPLTKLELVEIK